MPTCQQRADWAKKHVRSKEGRAFDLEGRGWVLTDFFIPADGWRMVARDVKQLCDECKPRVDDIVEGFSWQLWDGFLEHAHASNGACAGLKLVPIICVVLNLPRREGKTFNVCVFILTLIFLCTRRFVLFLAAAGDQTERLFTDNIEAVIDQSPAMKKSCQIVGQRVTVPSTRSRLDVAKTTSHRSIAGGGYTTIVLEEARDLEPRTVAAAVLSIRDQNGYECPANAAHVTRPGIGQGDYRKEKCPKCGSLLVPWYPRIIIPSSCGIVEDTERDWFNQLGELLETECPSNYYFFRTEKSTNPAVREDITDALADGFGRVDALKTFMDVELNNTPRRLGADFATKNDIKRITDPSLVSLEGSELPCVAFLDTSEVTDKTTLLICGWDREESAYPWQKLRPLHWKVWEPKKLGIKMKEEILLEHFDRFIPMFPELELVLVDDRGMVWAKDLVVTCNAKRRGWGGKIRLFHGKRVRKPDGRSDKLGARIPGVFGGEDDRYRGWQQFDQRIFTGPTAIVIPDRKELHAEILGVTKIETHESVEYRDRNRKKRHADEADAYAGCCFLAYLSATRTRHRLDPSYSAKTNKALASSRISNPSGGGGFGI